MDQFDPWQVVPRQVFTTYSRLLISTVFVVVIVLVVLGYPVWTSAVEKYLCICSVLSELINYP